MIDESVAMVLASAIAVLGTLGGAFLGPHFTRKHEKWRAAREDAQLLREKAAEFFDELDRIVSESHLAEIAAIRNLTETVEPSPLPDLGRVRMLVSVYFPSALPKLDSFEARSTELAKKMANEIQEAVKARNGGDRIKGINMLAINSQNKLTRQLVKEMRLQVAQNIPRL